MGSFFTDVLSFQHETAVFDVDPKRLRFVYNTYRLSLIHILFGPLLLSIFILCVNIFKTQYLK